MDVVGGFPLADGTSAKALTGIDDHSRMCVCARLMARERTRAVCDGLRAALGVYGAPGQILTDNGKVFTGRFHHPPVEVLFDAICRENGIDHLLTQPLSPTTTGKIERFHRSLRAEFLSGRAPFTNLKVAQQPLDEWVAFYISRFGVQQAAAAMRTHRRIALPPLSDCGLRGPRPASANNALADRVPARPTTSVLTATRFGDYLLGLRRSHIR